MSFVVYWAGPVLACLTCWAWQEAAWWREDRGHALIVTHPKVRKGDEPILGLPAIRGPLGVGVVRKDQLP